MKRNLRIAVGLIAATALSACGGVDSVTMSDGSRLEVASAGKGATEVAAWKFTDAKTGKEAAGVRETDSMAARIVPGLAQTVAGNTIQGAFGLAIEKERRKGCKNCGSGGGDNITVFQPGSVTASAGASADSTSDAVSQDGVKLGTMD